MALIARLCNGAKFDIGTSTDGKRVIKGDPTDTAVLRFAESVSVPFER
jgi:sodium/potassium-transporting ATPase subunit alpha